ncbi:MAG TPA: ATP-binding protein [Cyclobacteriaceae bacterium]|nr:ATP-binding protein [Cyclobacteriaceae bacterium]
MQTASDLTYYQATIDSQKDVLIFSIDRNYAYRNFNSAFKSATSNVYGTEVKTGMSMLESITSDDDRKKARANCDRALSGESHSTMEEYGTVNPSIFQTHYNPITCDGSVIGVTVLSLNITDKIVAEQKIKNLTKELESFTYTAAHDLRVPLRVIDGYSKILAEDYGDVLDDEGKKLVKIITSHAMHMGRLIDDLLHFAQLGRAALSMRMTDVKDIVRQVIDEQSLLQPDCRARFTVDDLPPCNCDPDLTRIIFSNLISNAIKFSSKVDKPIVEIGSIRKDNEVVYFVKDNGVGFNMEYSGKLFGLFQRLHKPTEFEGTGVGLAVVQRVVGKHGGKAWFEAALNKGATFYFTL